MFKDNAGMMKNERVKANIAATAQLLGEKIRMLQPSKERHAVQTLFPKKTLKK